MQQLNGKRVVVCENQGITATLMIRALSNEGLEVVAGARTGPEAVGAVGRTEPDIVLLDLDMDGDLDGTETAKQIVRQSSACVVLTCTLPADQGARVASEIGAEAFLTKPFATNCMLETVSEAWDRHTSREISCIDSGRAELPARCPHYD